MGLSPIWVRAICFSLCEPMSFLGLSTGTAQKVLFGIFIQNLYLITTFIAEGLAQW